MLRCLIAIICFCAISCNGMWVVKPGPKYPPTKGEVWPKPQYESKKDTFYTYNPSHFKVEVRSSFYYNVFNILAKILII